MVGKVLSVICAAAAERYYPIKGIFPEEKFAAKA